MTNIEQALDALNQAEEALNTWVNTYAPEHCDAAHVEAARARLREHGTLWYIASKLDALRAARKALEAAGKPRQIDDLSHTISFNDEWNDSADAEISRLKEAHLTESIRQGKENSDLFAQWGRQVVENAQLKELLRETVDQLSLAMAYMSDFLAEKEGMPETVRKVRDRLEKSGR